MYSLSITKRELNPNYKEELKSYRSLGYTNNQLQPQMYIKDQCMVIDLSDEEYQAIKKSLVEVF